MYPLIRMMWGENGNWEKIVIEPGAGFPVKVPQWTYYNVNYLVRSNIVKPFIFDMAMTALVRRFFIQDIMMGGKLKIPVSKDIPIIAPKYAWMDREFNIFSLVKRDYNICFDITMIPTSKGIDIINLLKNLDKINLIDYVDS